jgi:hypothetical protein
VWSPRGGELFYLDGKSALTAVPVATGSVFRVAGPPKKLFDTRYFSANQARSYDVSLDGQRFLFIKDATAETTDANATPASIVVTLNFFSELQMLRAK